MAILVFTGMNLGNHARLPWLVGLLAIVESQDSKPKEINEDQARRAIEIVKFCQQKLMNEIKQDVIFALREFKDCC